MLIARFIVLMLLAADLYSGTHLCTVLALQIMLHRLHVFAKHRKCAKRCLLRFAVVLKTLMNDNGFRP